MTNAAHDPATDANYGFANAPEPTQVNQAQAHVVAISAKLEATYGGQISGPGEFSQAFLNGDHTAAKILSRLLSTYHRAAEHVFLVGSTPWDIDAAMVAFGFSVGPFEMEDILGLDRIQALLSSDQKPAAKPGIVSITTRMMELGKLGRKTGAGWYRYPGGGGKVDDPIVADLALEEAHFAGLSRSDYSALDIVERVLLALICEVDRLLETGFDGDEIDLLSIQALGFPRNRGGLTHFTASMNSPALHDRIKALEPENPTIWTPGIKLA